MYLIINVKLIFRYQTRLCALRVSIKWFQVITSQSDTWLHRDLAHSSVISCCVQPVGTLRNNIFHGPSLLH